MLSNQQNSLFVYILLENLPMHNHIPMKQFHRVNHHRLGGRQNLPDTSLCLRYPHTSWNWLYSDPRMPICSLNVYKNIVNSFRPRSWLICNFFCSILWHITLVILPLSVLMGTLTDWRVSDGGPSADRVPQPETVPEPVNSWFGSGRVDPRTYLVWLFKKDMSH